MQLRLTVVQDSASQSRNICQVGGRRVFHSLPSEIRALDISQALIRRRRRSLRVPVTVVPDADEGGRLVSNHARW